MVFLSVMPILLRAASHECSAAQQFIQAQPAARLGLSQALGRMERSAINSYTAAGASIGVLFGLYIANSIVGTNNPEYLFSLTGLLAIPFAAGAHLLVSRRFRRAGRRQQLFIAVSGWVAFLASVSVLLVGIQTIFPKVIAA